MASFDFARFMPSESAYRNPGEAKDAYRAQALEKATTQSELERFYTTFEESKRQFNENLGFQREELGFQRETLAESSRQFDETLGERREEFGQTLTQRISEFSQTLEERMSEFEQTHELDTERFQFEKEMGPQYLNLQRDIYQSQRRGQDFGMGLDALGFIGGGGLSDVWGGVTDFFGGLF